MRSPTFERNWLDAVLREGGVWPDDIESQRFKDAVNERLEKGRAEYGDRPRPFEEFVKEGSEEGEDVPGWFVLAAQELDRTDLEIQDRAMIRAELVRAASHAFHIWQSARRIAAMYREAKARANWRLKMEVVGAPPPTLYFED